MYRENIPGVVPLTPHPKALLSALHNYGQLPLQTTSSRENQSLCVSGPAIAYAIVTILVTGEEGRKDPTAAKFTVPWASSEQRAGRHLWAPWRKEGTALFHGHRS